jgi:hypothetical protein
VSATNSCFEVLNKLGGIKDAKVTGSKEWRIDFYSKSYPPLAVEFLSKRDRMKIHEKIVKLLDIRKLLDARGILVAAPGSIDPQDLQVATGLEIYVVMSDDGSAFWDAVKGGDLADINRAAMSQAMVTRNRSLSQSCRSALLELLGERWLTVRELEDQLRWRFAPKTVASQIRSLQRSGFISVLGRTEKGEGILGMPQKSYLIRNDLSGPSKIAYLSKTISEMLASKPGRPLDHSEIAASLGISKHTAAAVLSRLSKQCLAERAKEGWKFKQ